jgi:spectinomycin phosphotransferase
MREPPRVTDATLRAALRAHYGLSATALTFLPLGNDTRSSVYRAEAGGAGYLLKVRTRAGFDPASLAIPRFLSEQGVPHIVAPLPTSEGALWVPAGDFVLTLAPFLDARTAREVGLSDAHWRALGAALRQIHASDLPPDLRRIVRQETFVPWRRSVLADLEPTFARADLADPAQRELAAFWRARQGEIRALIHRADTLGDELRRASLPPALCHADLHTWNVLLDTERRMWIVDWDEVILAPRERDLMFVVGGIGHGLVRPHETECFLQGYGNRAVDDQALTYYRYAWAVQDMAAYAEQAFSPDSSPQARREAVDGFLEQFAPGNIIAIARESDPDAP